MTVASRGTAEEGSFAYETPVFEYVRRYLRHRLFHSLTRDSLPLFFRGGDFISADPQLLGEHEPHVSRLIEHFADRGYADFLVDVGANIGLTSCQSGDLFKHVFMFEPNPDCFAILKVNSRIALRRSEVHLSPVGLGEASATRTLTVPKTNWGGAFIRDGTNSYSEDLLARKDGFDSIAQDNYEHVTIRVEPAAEILSGVFAKVARAGLRSGVVKIDVEGYEPVVLEALARVLPREFRLMVVFESWDAQLDTDSLAAQFGKRATAYRLARSPALRGPRLLKLLALIRRGGSVMRLEPASAGENHADIVLLIEPAAANRAE